MQLSLASEPVAMIALRKDRHVVVVTLEVGIGAVNVAVSPDGNRAYVANFNSPRLSTA